MTIEQFAEQTRAQVIQYMQHLNMLLSDDKTIEPDNKVKLIRGALSLAVYVQDDFEKLLEQGSAESIAE